jgi:hypothetical protein
MRQADPVVVELYLNRRLSLPHRRVVLLLEAGADPRLRTRIDDCETPRVMAERAGLQSFAQLLAEWESR